MRQLIYLCKRPVLLLTSLFISFFIGCTPSPKEISELKVGDPIPASLMRKPLTVVNCPGGDNTLTLRKYKNKLVILDFWETWCGVCVKSMSKFDTLAINHSDKLRVFLVSIQEGNVVSPFLTKKGSGLTAIVNGKFLSTYFPHKSVPHEVWIKDGKVFAITGHEAVTEENIRMVLSGEKTSLAELRANFDYDSSRPLLLDGNGGEPEDLQYRSLITGYIDGIGGGGVHTDNEKGNFRIRAINGDVKNLYQFALSRLGDKSLSCDNRCIMECTEEKILPPQGLPAYDTLARGMYYCYELIVPVALKDKSAEMMIEDLNRYFGVRYNINGVIEERMIDCWTIIMKGSTGRLISHSKTPKIINDVPGQIEYQRQPFSQICKTLNHLYRGQPMPVVDCTGITDEVDFILPLGIENITDLRPYLNKYGLDLKQEIKEIEMFVIRDLDR
jgi:thiol-disulfide isomerase/thioredoxin